MSTRAFRVFLAATAMLVLLVPATAWAGGRHSQDRPNVAHSWFGWWHSGHHHGNNGPTRPPALSPPLAQGLAGPLQLAVAGRGDVLVAQGFAPVLTKISRKGTTNIPVEGIDGIDTDGWRTQYTTRIGEPGEPGFSAKLYRLNWDGSGTQLADLWAYEDQANPDQVNSYGFTSISPECAAQLPAEVGPAQYTGQKDVNPYGVAIDRHHTYIADAGGNDIVKVRRDGSIKTVAVLPPQPVTVDDAIAAALHLPDCAKGLTYAFEPVPTDVETGRDGFLYVTTLPGGSEDPSLGARGSIYRINPWTGDTQRIATGFAGATNLALTPNGIYVSELFAGRISRVGGGGPVPFLDVASPAGLEYADGRLYVGYDVFANGSVATIKLGGGKHY